MQELAQGEEHESGGCQGLNPDGPIPWRVQCFPAPGNTAHHTALQSPISEAAMLAQCPLIGDIQQPPCLCLQEHRSIPRWGLLTHPLGQCS